MNKICPLPWVSEYATVEGNLESNNAIRQPVSLTHKTNRIAVHHTPRPDVCFVRQCASRFHPYSLSPRRLCVRLKRLRTAATPNRRPRQPTALLAFTHTADTTPLPPPPARAPLFATAASTCLDMVVLNYNVFRFLQGDACSSPTACCFQNRKYTREIPYGRGKPPDT